MTIIPVSPLDPSAVLATLTSEEKIALLSGSDLWHTTTIPRLGIPRVRLSDGPNGVRGTTWTNGAAASCFPCGTGLASSFDVNLLTRVGETLGDECHARGVHALLGPTVNIQRHPLGGRGFESFSEDPFLAGTLGAAWIQGLQSRNVMACPKHWIANEQELNRRSSNSVIDERTLHEIYIEPFRLLSRAKPATFMSSYNRVNGLHVSESNHLLRTVLRGQLGFDSLIMSDWAGTYSSSEAVKASLDLEMPGPSAMRGAALERDLLSTKLSLDELDDCVLRVLKFVQRAQLSGIPFEAPERHIESVRVRQLLRESADASIVLVKNDRGVLPLKLQEGMTVAVIGPNAATACYAGGGSASLPASYTVTPLDAIKQVAAATGASVSYTIGANASRWTPLLTPFIHDAQGENGGVQCRFFENDPWADPSVKPRFTLDNRSSYCYFTEGIPDDVPLRGYVSLRTTFVPDVSGIWELGLSVAGQADLYMDGRKVVDNSTDQDAGVLFFNTGSEERLGMVDVVSGHEYRLEVRFSNFRPISAVSPYAGRRGGVRVGGRPRLDPKDEIANAVKISKQADATILVIGTNGEWESESYDRDTMQLPGATDDLVRAVLSATPDAIVVNQSGMPVELPWLTSASTLVQAFFGGNECGTGIADVVFGMTNPSSRLPISWPNRVTDYPTHSEDGFGHPVNTVYSEGIYVGYRHPHLRTSANGFAFGHGLSYTTFDLSDLVVHPDGLFEANVSVKVTNTGARAGSEVVQVYVHQSRPSVDRPTHELKGFTKVYLEPGQSKVVSVHLSHEAWSFYSVDKRAWVGEPGTFEVRIGRSAAEIVLAKPFCLAQGFTYVGVRGVRPLE